MTTRFQARGDVLWAVFQNLKGKSVGDNHLYCDVCKKIIPDGTTFLSVSVQREHLVPDDNMHDVDGFAECVFQCHEQCVPESVEVDLEQFQK